MHIKFGGHAVLVLVLVPLANILKSVSRIVFSHYPSCLFFLCVCVVGCDNSCSIGCFATSHFPKLFVYKAAPPETVILGLLCWLNVMVKSALKRNPRAEAKQCFYFRFPGQPLCWL